LGGRASRRRGRAAPHQTQPERGKKVRKSNEKIKKTTPQSTHPTHIENGGTNQHTKHKNDKKKTHKEDHQETTKTKTKKKRKHKKKAIHRSKTKGHVETLYYKTGADKKISRKPKKSTNKIENKNTNTKKRKGDRGKKKTTPSLNNTTLKTHKKDKKKTKKRTT